MVYQFSNNDKTIKKEQALLILSTDCIASKTQANDIYE